MIAGNINRKIGRFVLLYLWITYVIYLLLLTLRDAPGNLEEWRTIVFLSFASMSFYLGCQRIKIHDYKYAINTKRTNYDDAIVIPLIGLMMVSIMSLRDWLSFGLATMSFNMGDNYVERLEADITANSFWGQLNNLFLPVRIIVIVFCTLHYKYLKIIVRILFMIFLSILILSGFFRGVLVGVGNILVYWLVPYFFVMRRNGKMKQFRWQLVWIFCSFVVFFVVAQLSRATAYDVSLSEKFSDNFFYDVFGERVGGGLLLFFSYFSHGYRGLNYSLQLPFVWTHGYGGSRALNEYLYQYFNIDSMYGETYPMRVKDIFGYDCEMSWPTAFSWWASDFSFPGVVVLLFFLGMLVCIVVKDAIKCYNTISISFLCQLVILVIFLPLNNQAFQARDSLIATVVLSFLWVIKKK